APTLLDLAGVAQPGTLYKGQPVEPMTGRSLLPVLRGGAERTHGPKEAIGYELSGNAAIYRGDLKLSRNLPPVGDGRWHLYDIASDPGETRDLKAVMPQEFHDLQADYAAYVQDNGVLPMPEGYEPRQQVLINALYNVYLPRLWPPGAALLVLCLAWALRRRQRRRSVQP
ncbi:MAG: hypothetical protein ACR2I0_01640, partial [Rhodoferax sp.]